MNSNLIVMEFQNQDGFMFAVIKKKLIPKMKKQAQEASEKRENAFDHLLEKEPAKVIVNYDAIKEIEDD